MRPVRPSALRVKSAVRERRQEEKRLRRQEILAAGKRVYSRKGFLSATIEDIAAEARVSVGTIYSYYKSKEDLYVSLLFESMEVFSRELTKILRSRRRTDLRACRGDREGRDGGGDLQRGQCARGRRHPVEHVHGPRPPLGDPREPGPAHRDPGRAAPARLRLPRA